MTMSRFVRGTLALAASACMLAACSTNPATGERFFNPISSAQLNAMGAQAAPELAGQFGGPVQNERLQQYVQRVGNSIAVHTEADFPKLEWEFTLLDSHIINAFALPGGKIFITRGLAERMTNEAQLAGVLGHEIGHVSAEHAARRIGQQAIFNTGLAVAGIAVGAQPEDSSLRQYGQFAIPALAIGGNLVLLSYGRDEESQADSLGMRYMMRAGYNPRGQMQVMEILRDAEQGGGRPPELLASHPMPETRINRIQRLLETDFAEGANLPFYEERWHNEFLSELRRLPASRQQSAPQTTENVGQLREGQAVISRPRR
jgi:predicted Zn-dependent protease